MPLSNINTGKDKTAFIVKHSNNAITSKIVRDCSEVNVASPSRSSATIQLGNVSMGRYTAGWNPIEVLSRNSIAMLPLAELVAAM